MRHAPSQGHAAGRGLGELEYVWPRPTAESRLRRHAIDQQICRVHAADRFAEEHFHLAERADEGIGRRGPREYRGRGDVHEGIAPTVARLVHPHPGVIRDHLVRIPRNRHRRAGRRGEGEGVSRVRAANRGGRLPVDQKILRRNARHRTIEDHRDLGEHIAD